MYVFVSPYYFADVVEDHFHSFINVYPIFQHVLLKKYYIFQWAVLGPCQRQIGHKCEGLFLESLFFPIWPVCTLVLSVYTCSNCKDSKLRSIKSSIASFFLKINWPVSFIWTSIKILWLLCHFFGEPALKFYRDHTESVPLMPILSFVIKL